MRWKCYQEGDVIDWHPWFAWYPITTNGQWVWLEWVERRRTAVFLDGFGLHWFNTYR